MARYIDADALIEEIESLAVIVTGVRAGRGMLSEYMKLYKKSILRIIDEQPTAYDIESVVQQLEEIERHYLKCALCDYNEGAAVGIREAIYRVRNGGKE